MRAVLLFYFFARNVIGGFMGKPKQPAFDEAGLPLRPTHYTPALATGTPLELRAFLAEDASLDPSSAQLVWHEQDVVLGNIPERTKTVMYRPSRVRDALAWVWHESSGLRQGLRSCIRGQLPNRAACSTAGLEACLLCLASRCLARSS